MGEGEGGGSPSGNKNKNVNCPYSQLLAQRPRYNLYCDKGAQSLGVRSKNISLISEKEEIVGLSKNMSNFDRNTIC